MSVCVRLCMCMCEDMVCIYLYSEVIAFLKGFFLEIVVSLACLYISKQVFAKANPHIVTYKLTIC